MKTLLLGDLSPTIATDPLFEKQDIDALFGDTIQLFIGNDVNFVNLECALTDSSRDIEKYGPPLKATAAVAQTLRQVGINYCGLSNNHIFDFGIKGVRDTMDALDRAGIVHTGFGMNYADSRRDLVIEKQGEKIAIIAVCEHEYSYALEDRMGSRPFDEYDTMDDIRSAKGHCDRVVVIYHGGKEHCRYPSARLHKLCRAMIRNGADVVLCQHSHCIGCYEKYNNGHILYGQGNFHFVNPPFLDDELAKTWNESLAVKYDTKSNKMEFVPLVVNGDGICAAQGEKKSQILESFEARNKNLANGTWMDEWKAFCKKVAPMYLSRMKNAFQADANAEEKGIVGHYLDCEAHTDVLRELFPTANQTNEKM